MKKEKEQKVPVLRFPEFRNEGDWEREPFERFIKINSGKGFNAAEYSDNGIRLLQIENVGYGVVKWSENTVYLPHRYVLEYPELVLQEGDIILALNRPVTNNKLKIARLKKYDAPSILYQRVGKIVVISESIINNFVFYICQNFIKYFVIKQSIGSDQPFISLRELYAQKITIPYPAEQQKIASFLSAVDTKIEQIRKKKVLLEQYKKGIVQKLFSQEIRFKDENGNDFPEWEEKRFGDLFKISSGRDYKELDKGNIPVYGTGGYITSVDDYLHNGESVCIGRKGTIDNPIYLNGKFWTVDTLFYTHSFTSSVPKFIYALFQTINWKKYNEASGVPSLSKKTIENIKTSIPQSEEQRKIADFLSSIDKKIDLVATELTHAQTFKKGLLQQMFI